MDNWPIGLSTGCFYQRSIFDCLALIRESGFCMIEVCFSPAHLDYHDPVAVQRAAKQITELGMEAYSFHAPFASHLDISSLHAPDRRLALQEITRAAEAAAMLGVHYFVIHPGPETSVIPPAAERLQRMENVIEVLNVLTQRCRELGVQCVLENKLPHLLFGHTSDILWILDGLDSVDVGVCLDTGHGFLSGDLEKLLHKLSGHLKMIHAHDNNRHGDDHLPPGDGRIFWPMVMEALTRGHFSGAFILELAGHADPAITMENARRGRSYLRQIGRSKPLAPKMGTVAPG